MSTYQLLQIARDAFMEGRVADAQMVIAEVEGEDKFEMRRRTPSCWVDIREGYRTGRCDTWRPFDPFEVRIAAWERLQLLRPDALKVTVGGQELTLLPDPDLPRDRAYVISTTNNGAFIPGMIVSMDWSEQ